VLSGAAAMRLFGPGSPAGVTWPPPPSWPAFAWLFSRLLSRFALGVGSLGRVSGPRGLFGRPHRPTGRIGGGGRGATASRRKAAL